MTAGERIRQLREQRGWSQEQLAVQGAPVAATDAQTVAGELAAALAEAGDDPEFRRYVIERLDVQVVLYAAADGQHWSLTCLLGAGAGIL